MDQPDTPTPMPAHPQAPVLRAEPTRAPYPLLALLAHSALLRDDITEGCTGTALALNLRFVEAGTGAPIVNAAVYCRQASPAPLRGVQVTDPSGRVRLRTLLPEAQTDHAGLIELQICLNDRVHVSAIANTRLHLPAAALRGNADDGFEAELTLAITTAGEAPATAHCEPRNDSHA